jgi:alkyl sulfatase BDS1-like metallo-beta-lactamase superfamily hydrolase
VTCASPHNSFKHATFAEPDNAEAKELLAQVFERLGYGAECGTWRNNYLTAAQELREGAKQVPISAGSMASALSVDQVFDSLAVRVNGPEAWEHAVSTHWHFTDLGERHQVVLRNGVLVHYATGRTDEDTDLALTLTKAQLAGMLAGQAGLDGIEYQGDPATPTTLMSVLDEPEPSFPIVTP